VLEDPEPDIPVPVVEVLPKEEPEPDMAPVVPLMEEPPV
jgi:hypothetical protein